MITSAALAAFGMGTMLTADSAQAAKKQRGVDEVQQALKEQYPDAKLEKTGDRQINGVQVSDYRVTTKEGDSTAEITQYGDFVLWGKPRVATQGQAMSQPARDTLSGLFKGSTNDVDVFQTTFYAVDVQTASNKGGKQQTFRLRFDPVGRLRTVEKVTAENKGNGMIEGMDKATGADAQKAQDYAKKYVKDANVESVYSVPGEEGFYLVDMKGSDGKDEKITVSNAGRILSQIEQLDKGELPPPVTQAIDQYFNGERIQTAYREDSEFYQLNQQAAGGNVTIRIRPDGEVMSVSNPQAEEDRASTASERQSPAKKSSSNSKK